MVKKIIFIFLFLIAATAGQAEVVDQIVAEVNGEIITYSELKRMLDPIYDQYSKMYQGEELLRRIRKAREEALNQLIENKIVVQEANQLGLQLNENVVEERIREIKNKFKSEEEFLQALKNEGSHYDEFTKNVRDQFIIKAFINQQVTSKVLVTPKEIKEYYEAHLNEFSGEEKVHLYLILVKKDPENLMLSKETAIQIGAKLRNGGSFEELAKNYSEGPHADQGGDLGFVKRGQLVRELEDKAFALEAGAYSDVIESAGGYYIVWVKEKEKGETQTLEHVEKELESFLFKKKASEIHQKWIATLKKKAYIHIFE